MGGSRVGGAGDGRGPSGGRGGWEGARRGGGVGPHSPLASRPRSCSPSSRTRAQGRVGQGWGLMFTLPRSFGSGGWGHMTSGNPSRDGSGGAVSSVPALPSASPWRRSPWGQGSGLRAAGSVLGRGCACPASRPPRPLRARAPCHACVAGRGPPCHPASSRPGQSPEPGWGRPALEGEEGRLWKTGPAGGQLSALG